MDKEQNNFEIESYLIRRGVKNDALADLLIEGLPKSLEGASIFADDEEFELSHLLDASGRIGYDIADVNQAFGLGGDPRVAIALVAGDDPICVNAETGVVTVILFEEGVEKKLADSLEEFKSAIYVNDSEA